MDALESLQREHLLLKWMVADLKLDLLRREFARKGGYNEEQPRDELGRWTNDSSGEATDLSSAKRLPPIVEEFGDWVARQFISKHCKAWINREFPGEFEDSTIAEIHRRAEAGDARARRCMKLFKQHKWRK